MCGIAGICVPEHSTPPDRDVLLRMTRTLRHRGPDGEGTYLNDVVGLGHRRLSIIDLATGSQPMFNEDRSIAIVFNGEIYNYLELKPDLERKGHKFTTTSDTEVILHLYEDMGTRCLEVLNGMFAFALWDGRRRRLMLARDRLGEKPLFYRFVDGRLTYASELKALLKDPSFQPEISLPALDDYLAYGYVPHDRCILQGVNKLLPGHRLVWQDGRITIDKYWDVCFDETPVDDERAWLEELERRLRQAVRIRLRSDVPLGVFLSGGVDSSGIVALASQESAGRLKTFSVGFNEADFDELHYARMVADRYETDHHEIVVSDHDLGVLPDIVHHLDEPFADPSALPTYYICREARRQVTVCLSGDGGDEAFAGYQRYRQAMKYRRFDSVAMAPLRHVCGLLARVMPAYIRGKGMLQRIAATGADRYFSQCEKFSAAERRQLFREDALEAVHDAPWLFAPYFASSNGRHLVTTLQHTDQKTYLPDDILVKTDRMSMQSSLEVRVPLLDHTLVEFVNKAPASLKLGVAGGKYALKKVLEPHLPADVLHRKKQGFGIPIKHWFRGDMDALARDLLLSPSSKSSRLFRKEAIVAILRGHRRGMRDLSRKLWALLVFEQWCRNYQS